jgi:hypothetical protein
MSQSSTSAPAAGPARPFFENDGPAADRSASDIRSTCEDTR